MLLAFDLEAQQKQLSQEDQAHVPMPRGPGAVFVVVQPEFGFVFLKKQRSMGQRAPLTRTSSFIGVCPRGRCSGRI